MRRAILIAGMAFGDEGKGATVDKICRTIPVDVIVRAGGFQAAHNVITPDGEHHVFAQFGSGMLASNTVKTHLSRYMVVEPVSMMSEAEALIQLTPNLWNRLTVDRNAIVCTPVHAALNRLREFCRGDERHGSCGRGIGVAREMQIKFGEEVLMVKDLSNRDLVIEKLMHSVDYLLEEAKTIAKQRRHPTWGRVLDVAKGLVNHYLRWPAQVVDGLEPAETMLFEGAHGVMLDETHGTAPHNTWTDTTFKPFDTMLDELGITDRLRIGCLRSYYTRHGAGPFPTEEPGLKSYLPEQHNSDREFAGPFRVGKFDYDLAKHALGIVEGVDYLAVSHLDRCMALGVPEQLFLDRLWTETATPVGIYGRGPTADDRTISTALLEKLMAAVPSDSCAS